MTTSVPDAAAAEQRAPAVLLDAALHGDEEAWVALVLPHVATLRATARAVLRGNADVDDVVQEVLLRAWTRLDQLQDPECTGPWLAAIARRVALDRLRNGQRSSALMSVVASLREHRHVELPDEAVVAQEEAAVLLAHLAALSDRDAQVLWRRDALGEPVGDLAAEHGLTEGSTRVLLHRARTRLRQGLEGVAAVLVGLGAATRERLDVLEASVALAPATAVVAAVTLAGLATLPTTSPPPQQQQDELVAPVRSPAPATPAPARQQPEPRPSEPATATPTPTPAGTGMGMSATAPGPVPSAPDDEPLVDTRPPEGAEPDVRVGGNADPDDGEEPDDRPGVAVFLSDVFSEGCEDVGGLVLEDCEDPDDAADQDATEDPVDGGAG